jgi:hypothetical protein
MRENGVGVHGHYEVVVGKELLEDVRADPRRKVICHLVRLVVFVVVAVDHGVHVVVGDGMRHVSGAAELERIPVNLLVGVENLVGARGCARVDVDNEEALSKGLVPGEFVRLCALKVRPCFIVVACLCRADPNRAKELLYGTPQC